MERTSPAVHSCRPCDEFRPHVLGACRESVRLTYKANSLAQLWRRGRLPLKINTRPRELLHETGKKLCFLTVSQDYASAAHFAFSRSGCRARAFG